MDAASDDVAADRIAPWARPATAWLWVAAPADLQPAGLTPAPPDIATVTLAVSEDPHLLDAARPAGDELPVLPGWRVWVDLVHQGRDDAALPWPTHSLQGGPDNHSPGPVVVPTR